MKVFKILHKLTGLTRGDGKLDNSFMSGRLDNKTKELREDLPEGDRVTKKRNWIASKNKK